MKQQVMTYGNKITTWNQMYQFYIWKTRELAKTISGGRAFQQFMHLCENTFEWHLNEITFEWNYDFDVHTSVFYVLCDVTILSLSWCHAHVSFCSGHMWWQNRTISNFSAHRFMRNLNPTNSLHSSDYGVLNPSHKSKSLIAFIAHHFTLELLTMITVTTVVTNSLIQWSRSIII